MKKLLIANRGEIAVRLIRAARDYGVASVAVYAEADHAALHVAMADEAWSLGAGRPAETYLDIGRILALARASGADAVHPGYGFLSERAEFAEAVLAAGLVWVGPPPAVIRALGDKVEARRIAARVGAPLVRGSDGPLASGAEALAFARTAGLPLAIKAAFGGGGRGMKIARHLDEVEGMFDSAMREAEEAFGRGDCYAEQFLDRPRHIEAQVLGDLHGNLVVLGTRDCSLQRRNQKLVEEAPAPFLSDALRDRIHRAARDICAAVGYTSAGTVEFLLSETGTLSFLEVNTRLQVEHPVTEETTGLDIAVEQLRIADGLPLRLTDTPPARGHAFEFRINAEDPGRGFLPTPGRISRFDPPAGPGVRLDSGIRNGDEVSPLYDGMIAKLVVWGETRAAALARARRALAEFGLEGVATVLPFHRAVIEDPAFAGPADFAVHTGWIEDGFAGLPPGPRVPAPGQRQLLHLPVEIDGKRHDLGLPPDLLALLLAGGAGLPPPATVAAPPPPDGDLQAPLAGRLAAWLVEDGAMVAEGEALAVIEAMKMENRLTAPRAGRLQITAAAGSALAALQSLGRID